MKQSEELTALEKQIDDKVIPYMKDNRIPGIIYLDGINYLIGTKEHMLKGLGGILKGIISKYGVSPVEIVALLAFVNNKLEKKDECD